MAQAPLDRSLARPTDAPPLAHAGPADGSSEPSRPRPSSPTLRSCRPTSCPGTSRSSWTATAAGRAPAASPTSRATPPGSRRSASCCATRSGAVSRCSRCTRSAARTGPAPTRRSPACSGCWRRRSATRPTSCAPRASGCGSSAGSRSSPKRRRRPSASALDRTSEGTRLQLNIAWNYAGRTELVDAFRRIAATGIPPDAVDERTIGEALYTGGLPDPDLVVRTGGEQRISNFLIWQSAYAELVFTERLWPDFGPDAFDEALLEFASRTRRFGR